MKVKMAKIDSMKILMIKKAIKDRMMKTVGMKIKIMKVQYLKWKKLLVPFNI